MESQRQYPERKERELLETEKREIRKLLDSGEADIYELARQFNCSSSQIAGIKAAMKR